MLVEQRGTVTPGSSPSMGLKSHMSLHNMPQDLSPGNSNSSSSAPNSTSSNGNTPVKSDKYSCIQTNEDFSALQRLQIAIEKNSYFSISTLFGDRRPEAHLEDDKNLSPSPGLDGSVEGHESVGGSEKSSGRNSTDHITRSFVETPETSPNSPSQGNGPSIFQCPLCSVISNGRHSFNEHLVSHTQQLACAKCSYLTSNEDQLMEHMSEVHDVNNDAEMSSELDEASVPKINSQGKVKTFKCKQCEYLSVTKKDFWDHSKSHIRTEKMLTCPKCPFVTEYKHHLEYHLRNHFGSKPFQCTKCSYTCVNKSMLNSHLKSHSNIYQYRCSDCSYATKYCHSLKLHLRKYGHNPSMVLNPDGTPNPLPIIDVYGTRRGPKIKRTDLSYPEEATSLSPQHSPIIEHKSRRRLSESDSEAPKAKKVSLEIKREKIPEKEMMMEDEKHSAEISPRVPIGQLGGPGLELYAAALNQYIFSNPLLPLANFQAQLANGHREQLLAHMLQREESVVSSTPLDLRNPRKDEEPEEKRRKRKGKAIRYKVKEEEEEEALDFSNNNWKETGHHRNEMMMNDGEMKCKYCEISFPDRVLYSMHMNYHSGDESPFNCKSCGKKTADKVSFFLHLTTEAH